mgnify:CR=1 FL=1
MDEYQECLRKIEAIRAEREVLLAEIKKLQCQLEKIGMQTEVQSSKTLRDAICSLEEQDEKLGAQMHALAIKRNLLEP